MPSRVISDAIARASAALDRRAVRFMERSMRQSGPGRPPADARRRLIALGDQYATPANLAQESGFFPRPEPAEVTAVPVGRGLPSEPDVRLFDLSYPSLYRPMLAEHLDEYARYGENLTVHARLYAHREPRPTAICLHGWGGGAYWLEERSFVVSYLAHIGLDVVLFNLPYHGRRSPRQASRSGALFPSAHVVRTNEGFGQAIHDLRALAGYLRDRGAPAVGAIGMSLGGYTSALWASLDPSLAFAVPMIPAVSMSELMWRHGADTPARRRVEKLGISQDLLDRVFAVHSPLTRAPQIPRERQLIVAGRGDRITPPDQAEALWRHWDRPELHWFAGGHLAQVGRGGAFRRVRAMLGRAGLIDAAA